MLLLWKTSKYKPIKVDKTTIINLEREVTTTGFRVEEAVLGAMMIDKG
jgi:hypothetical protein